MYYNSKDFAFFKNKNETIQIIGGDALDGYVTPIVETVQFSNATIGESTVSFNYNTDYYHPNRYHFISYSPNVFLPYVYNISNISGQTIKISSDQEESIRELNVKYNENEFSIYVKRADFLYKVNKITFSEDSPLSCYVNIDYDFDIPIIIGDSYIELVIGDVIKNISTIKNVMEFKTTYYLSKYSTRCKSIDIYTINGNIDNNKIKTNMAWNPISNSSTIYNKTSVYNKIIGCGVGETYNVPYGNIEGIPQYSFTTYQYQSINSIPVTRVQNLIFNKNTDYHITPNRYNYVFSASKNFKYPNRIYLDDIKIILFPGTTPEYTSFLSLYLSGNITEIKVNGETKFVDGTNTYIDCETQELFNDNNIISTIGVDNTTLPPISFFAEMYEPIIRRPSSKSDFFTLESLENVFEITDNRVSNRKYLDNSKYKDKISSYEEIDSENTLTINENEIMYNNTHLTRIDSNNYDDFCNAYRELLLDYSYSYLHKHDDSFNLVVVNKLTNEVTMYINCRVTSCNTTEDIIINKKSYNISYDYIETYVI